MHFHSLACLTLQLVDFQLGTCENSLIGPFTLSELFSVIYARFFDCGVHYMYGLQFFKGLNTILIFDKALKFWELSKIWTKINFKKVERFGEILRKMSILLKILWFFARDEGKILSYMEAIVVGLELPARKFFNNVFAIMPVKLQIFISFSKLWIEFFSDLVKILWIIKNFIGVWSTWGRSCRVLANFSDVSLIFPCHLVLKMLGPAP